MSRFLIIFLLVLPCLAFAESESLTIRYLLCLPPSPGQEIRGVSQPVEFVTTQNFAIANLYLTPVSERKEQARPPERPNPPKPPSPPPPHGYPPSPPPPPPPPPCSGTIDYPSTGDTNVWSPPSNPSGELPCPPETDPNYPGDQPLYISIPEQSWSP